MDYVRENAKDELVRELENCRMGRINIRFKEIMRKPRTEAGLGRRRAINGWARTPLLPTEAMCEPCKEHWGLFTVGAHDSVARASPSELQDSTRWGQGESVVRAFQAKCLIILFERRLGADCRFRTPDMLAASSFMLQHCPYHPPHVHGERRTQRSDLPGLGGIFKPFLPFLCS